MPVNRSICVPKAQNVKHTLEQAMMMMTSMVLSGSMTPLLLKSPGDIVLSGSVTPLLLKSSVDIELSGNITPLLLKSSCDIKTRMVSPPPQTQQMDSSSNPKSYFPVEVLFPFFYVAGGNTGFLSEYILNFYCVFYNSFSLQFI
jgi:hypothetical protein